MACQYARNGHLKYRKQRQATLYPFVSKNTLLRSQAAYQFVYAIATSKTRASLHMRVGSLYMLVLAIRHPYKAAKSLATSNRFPFLRNTTLPHSQAAYRFVYAIATSKTRAQGSVCGSIATEAEPIYRTPCVCSEGNQPVTADWAPDRFRSSGVSVKADKCTELRQITSLNFEEYMWTSDETDFFAFCDVMVVDPVRVFLARSVEECL